MKKIEVVFLDGEVIKGETDSLPSPDNHLFYIRVNEKRRIIGTAGIKFIDIIDKKF